MIPGCFIDLALVPMPGLAVLYAMPKALNVIAATTPMMPKKVAFGGRVRQRHVRHVQAGAGSPRCCYCSSRIKVRSYNSWTSQQQASSKLQNGLPAHSAQLYHLEDCRAAHSEEYVGTGGVAPRSVELAFEFWFHGGAFDFEEDTDS
ncbi:hypothetical protein HPB49_005362 [Dermacentor silvarum]|uniref:Uncharacterized protein n=1 Tax=Dermacentor silvarum TaxID=543639 RepID=A0ACB8DVK2_DERSI|nr:uncharacterized protein LOC119450400 isoform X1 [Dermacentor silvarum]XP_049511277.1 uncharacterized protein LOC119450400 isoform X2 [Dermacentor silvarum]KAH7978369.1 hypothetical protein HPB49_005362 [Dermacentor silvarum]